MDGVNPLSCNSSYLLGVYKADDLNKMSSIMLCRKRLSECSATCRW